MLIQDVTLLDGSSLDIRIVNGVIDATGSLVASGEEAVLQGRGGLCLRPLVDAHLHLDKAGMVGTGTPPASIEAAIDATHEVKLAARSDPERLTERLTHTLRGLAANRTRTVRAVVDVDETWELTAFEAAKAARDNVEGVIDVRIVAFPQEGITSRVVELLETASESGASAIGAHTDIDTDPCNHLDTATRIAREAHLPLEVHVDEGASPDRLLLPKVLELAGDLESLTLVHCLSLATLADEQRAVLVSDIRSSGASVVVAPSVLWFGLGLAPVVELLAGGVPVLTGSDNLRDMFVPLGTGRVLDLLRIVALTGGVTAPDHLSALMDGATAVGGAVVTGDVGAFEPGTSASFVVFEGADARAVLSGQDRVRLEVINGSLIEEP